MRCETCNKRAKWIVKVIKSGQEIFACEQCKEEYRKLWQIECKTLEYKSYVAYYEYYNGAMKALSYSTIIEAFEEMEKFYKTCKIDGTLYNRYGETLTTSKEYFS